MERPELRAADADRQRVVDLLQRHFVDGRLSSDELGERLARARAARTFGELDALVGDLPAAAAPEPNTIGVGEAPAAAPDDKSLRTHAIVYALVMAFLVVIWLVTSPGGYFWPVWPMVGWGFGLAMHGLMRWTRR